MDEVTVKAIAVTSQVFETMFFTPLEAQEKGASEPGMFIPSASRFLRGEIGFEGEKSGRMILTLPVELARIMTSNFLGLEAPEIFDVQAVDMVNELCNILCGNLFASFNQKVVWKLTIPQTQMIEGEVIQEDDGHQEVTVCFNAEGYPVHLKIRFDSAG